MDDKADVLKRFAKRVRELRRAAGFSQEAFAAECWLNRTYMGGIERGLVDALVESGTLLDQAVAVAETLAALPPHAFALTKRQLRAPMMQRVRDDGPHIDGAVHALWEAPATLAAIRAYVARTLKR
jgi:transcriptional regulator with XRE-family HTH domain